jgi:hypothetical protein
MYLRLLHRWQPCARHSFFLAVTSSTGDLIDIDITFSNARTRMLSIQPVQRIAVQSRAGG